MLRVCALNKKHISISGLKDYFPFIDAKPDENMNESGPFHISNWSS